MATITALTAQKRNADRVNVYLDGEFAFGLALTAALELVVGQELSAQDVAALQAQDDVERARDSALRLITYRPRSTAEVRRHLRSKQFDDAVIDQAIERLARVDLLNDAAFAAYWIEQRETFKPRSQLALRQELQEKGLSREIIDQALEMVDETDAARRAAEKQAYRWAALPEDEFRLKLGRFLQRRGFTYDIIKQTTQEVWQDITAGHDSDPGAGG